MQNDLGRVTNLWTVYTYIYIPVLLPRRPPFLKALSVLGEWDYYCCYAPMIFLQPPQLSATLCNHSFFGGGERGNVQRDSNWTMSSVTKSTRRNSTMIRDLFISGKLYPRKEQSSCGHTLLISCAIQLYKRTAWQLDSQAEREFRWGDGFSLISIALPSSLPGDNCMRIHRRRSEINARHKPGNSGFNFIRALLILASVVSLALTIIKTVFFISTL